MSGAGQCSTFAELPSSVHPFFSCLELSLPPSLQEPHTDPWARTGLLINKPLFSVAPATTPWTPRMNDAGNRRGRGRRPTGSA